MLVVDYTDTGLVVVRKPLLVCHVTSRCVAGSGKTADSGGLDPIA